VESVSDGEPAHEWYVSAAIGYRDGGIATAGIDGMVGRVGIASIGIVYGLLGTLPLGEIGPSEGDIKERLGLVETVDTAEPIALAGDDSPSVADESFFAAAAAAWASCRRRK